jgi:hypothetical protein
MDDKTDKTGVYKAIVAVQGELAKEGIAKDKTCTQGATYKFRGIDDVYNALAPFLSKHGLCILPRILSKECVERMSKSGSPLFYTTITAEFDFVCAADGSSHTVRTYGEAMDSGDKGCNKSMSAAYKYAVIQTFCIPTEGDNDADAHTDEVLAATKPSAVPAARAANAKKMQALQTPKKATPSDAAPPLDWEAFLDYASDDPDRMNVITQLKEALAIGMVSDLQGEARVSFIKEFQQSCKDTGVPCEEWVPS